MLKELFIQNVAVIEKASVSFGPQLNVFTGETGAGKSVLIGAINAISGQRVSKDMIRTGASRAFISAVFSDLPSSCREKLASYGYEEEDGELIISREIQSDGKGSIRIGGRPATRSVLRDIVSGMVNIHGQHDSQILLDPQRHLSILDAFGELQPLVEAYQEPYRRLRALDGEIGALQISESEKAQKVDMLSYQIEEIESAQLEAGEEELLTAELRRIRGAEQILSNLQAAYDCLSGGDDGDGAVALCSSAADEIGALGDIYAELPSLAQRLNAAGTELDDIMHDIASYLSDTDTDPARMDYVEDRLDLIRHTTRKYGGSAEAALEHLADAKAQLAQIETAEDTLQQLNREREQVFAQAQAAAQSLSCARRQAADRFSGQVCEQLAFLNMPGVRLECAFHVAPELGADGMDNVEFLISANAGEAPRPMARIASGGELSRIMLAIKTVLADKDDVPTLIFDEIDAGVSGLAAERIGQKLQEIAAYRQVLCVTHLAQLAVRADAHLLIEKSVRDGRTFTQILPLDEDGRLREIARIMGGSSQTRTMLEGALELLASSRRKP